MTDLRTQLVLLPRPQRLLFTGEECHSAARLAQVHKDTQAVPQAQGYELTIEPQGIRIVAHDDAGIFYGQQTLRQIVGQFPAPEPLPGLRIRDWPDFPARGVMLDISRDKVPTLNTLLALVDRLAAWKVNQFQLYTEHTFAYPGHERVWQDASPVTPDEIRKLDAYCRERFIELVPNQNSFGHMHRWLKFPEYRHLGETAEGIDHPFTQGVKEPFSLCPTEPRAVEFLAGLYADLLPNFTSRLFNVGCDETFDLGLGRSAAACQARGKGRVYLEFLCAIRKLAEKHGRRMMFWADIIHEHPELLGDVPKDLIALEWGYWEFHSFDERCRRLAESGLQFYVCPGTSSWNSVVGQTTNAVGNIRAAAHLGMRRGAAGLLNTDWGDNGHHQPLPVSYLGYACGAAMSWAYGSNQTLDLPAALDRFAFHDRAGVLGRVAWDLGNTYLHAGGWSSFMLLIHAHRPRSSPHFKGVAIENLLAAKEHLARVMANLEKAAPGGPDGALILEEFRYAAGVNTHGCNLGLARWSHPGEGVEELPAAVRGALVEELAPLLEQHRRVWLARNRDGGRADSVARLERVLGMYGTAGARGRGSGAREG